MKKTCMASLALCAALAVSLAGCGNAPTVCAGNSAANSGAGYDASEPIDDGQGMVNPLVELESWSALHDALGLPVAAPNFARNVKYFLLDKDIAQITFTLQDGLNYSLRATKRSERTAGVGDSIRGVYGKAQEENSIVVLSGERTVTVTQLRYSENTNVYEWEWDGVHYYLVCQPAEGESLAIERLSYRTSRIAEFCAAITASAPSAKDARRYVEATHQNRGARQKLAEYRVISYEEIDKNALPPETATYFENTPLDLGSNGIEDSMVDGMMLLDVLKEDASAVLCVWEAVTVGQDGAQRTDCFYDFLQQAENGSYYIVSTYSNNNNNSADE